MNASAHTFCRRLRDEELDLGLEVLHEAYDWLSEQSIRQWTQPLSSEVYNKWQDDGYNYAVLVNNDIAAVFSLVWGPLNEWDVQPKDSVLWLHALATCRKFRGRATGEHAVKSAIGLASRQHEPLYLACAYGTGFLPSYYRRLGFKMLKREMKSYGKFGEYDMVLMIHRPSDS